MMFRLQLIAVFSFMSLFLLLLVGAVILNDESNQAEVLMTAPENCVGMCLLGIRPGKTTVRESVTHLQNHRWVTDVIQNAPGNGYAEINWDWSGHQPSVIDASKRGRITFYYHEGDTSGISLNDLVIQTMTIYTRIPIYAFQEWFGETSTGNVNNSIDGKLGYTVYYDVPGGIMILSTEMVCPVTIVSYWNAMTRMTVSIGNSKDPYINPSDMIRLC